ncbi:MAG: NUDIX hydrolase [Candidatus Promineifilaceae bacterium]|nr:NUDIX hydrolase [Candidatus Promineifilaceae bacterium]
MSNQNDQKSAPPEIAFCPKCGGALITRMVTDKPRRACPECGYIHFTDPKVGVGVLLVQDRKILLVRRRMDPERGKWSIPAGFLDRGENPQETAVREAFEETGLEVVIEDLVDVYYNPPPQDGASIFILYRANLLGGEMQAGDDADAVGFFGLDELPELAFASTQDAINQIRTSIGNVDPQG